MVDPGTLYGLTVLGGVLGRLLTQGADVGVNGSFAKRQRLLDEIHRGQAERNEATSRARSRYEAELRAAEAKAAFGRQLELVEFQSRTQIISQLELAILKVEIDSSPFRADPELVHQRAAEMCGRGSRPRPLLLIAPMRHEDQGPRNGSDAPAFSVARRQSWLDHPGHDDLVLADGLVKRPLIHTDSDVHLIKQVLWDLPVVLLHGDVEAGIRVLPEVTAWNLGPYKEGPIHLRLPKLDLPAPHSKEAKENERDRLAVGDHLGGICAWTAGVLAEWFHTTRHGRTPKLHRRLTDGPERQLAATCGAQLLAEAAACGSVDPAAAVLRQATILVEGGLGADAHQSMGAGQTVLDVAARQCRGEAGRQFIGEIDRLIDAMKEPSRSVPVELWERGLQIRATSLQTWLGYGESPDS